jgi:predicted phage terminase large subunit-like protein
MLKKDKDKQNQLKKLSVIQAMCKTCSLFFTRYFFKKRFDRKFVVNFHHRIIFAWLNKIYKGEIKRVIINIAPRYGKTESAVINFIACGIGINAQSKYMHLSYSDGLVLENSEFTKDIVDSPAFKEIYGHIDIKTDSRSKQNWKTTKGGGMYATSISGQVTGFGSGLVDVPDEAWEFSGGIIIDDPIKPDDADYAIKRDLVNKKFDSTLKNRVNSRNTPIIMIGQRVHPEDLAGHLLAQGGWDLLCLPAILDEEQQAKIYDYVNDEGEIKQASIRQLFEIYHPEILEKYKESKELPLWDFKHTLEELYQLRAEDVTSFERQYMQNPKPQTGLMYPMEWKTYKSLPFELKESQINSYTDTADLGNDYLCDISYVDFNELKYVVDIIYTQDPQEITEKQKAEKDRLLKVNYSLIESNNGGRSFSRNVERISRELGNYITTYSWFHQSQNKESRIKTNSSTVQNKIVFPSDWAIKWPKFYDHITTYMRDSKNRYDDCADTLTGIVEKEPYGDQWATIH